EPEALRLLARAVAPGAVAADTVLGEQRAAALGRRRLRRQRLVADARALGHRRAEGLDLLAPARGGGAPLQGSPPRAQPRPRPAGARRGRRAAGAPVGAPRLAPSGLLPSHPPLRGGGPPPGATPP